MANFIQKFADMHGYIDAEHQYPNISLVEGEGLIWEAEAQEPEPDVLLNGSKIKWNVTDGQERTSVDYPSISFEDAQTLINALNNGDEVSATGWYDDGKSREENVEFTFNGSTDEIGISVNKIAVATVYLFGNTKAPVLNAVGIGVSKADNPNASWEINYVINPAE